LNSKQKSLCQLETTELFSKETLKETKKKRNSKKMTKTRLGLLVPWISGSSFIQPRGPLFLSLMFANSKVFFKIQDKRVAIFQEKLSTLSIWCKSDKLRQTNFTKFQDDFVMKARKKSL